MTSTSASSSHLRHRPLVALVAAGLVLFASAGVSVAPANAQVVKMATLVPDGSSWHLVLKETADKWKKISNGRVTLSSTPAASPVTTPTSCAR